MYKTFISLLNFFRIHFQDPTNGSVNTDNFIVLDSVAPIHDVTNGDVY